MNGVSVKRLAFHIATLFHYRSQFPPTPAVAPVIPAWQLQRNTEAAKKTDNSAVVTQISSSDQILVKDIAEADSETVKTDSVKLVST